MLYAKVENLQDAETLRYKALELIRRGRPGFMAHKYSDLYKVFGENSYYVPIIPKLATAFSEENLKNFSLEESEELLKYVVVEQ